MYADLVNQLIDANTVLPARRYASASISYERSLFVCLCVFVCLSPVCHTPVLHLNGCRDRAVFFLTGFPQFSSIQFNHGIYSACMVSLNCRIWGAGRQYKGKWCCGAKGKHVKIKNFLHCVLWKVQSRVGLYQKYG